MRDDCPDCGGALVPIRLLAAAGAQGDGIIGRYTSADSKQSRWDGRYPALGAVRACMCPECGRVLLFAERPADRLPLPAQPPDEDRGPLPLPSEAGPEQQ